MAKLTAKDIQEQTNKYVNTAAVSIFVLWVFCASYFQISLNFSWLITVNLIAFFTYGYDKRIAKFKHSKSVRIPERLLHALTIFGGGFGAYAGMRLFKHKTSKKSFQWYFKICLLLSFFLFYLVLKFNRGDFA